MHSSGSGPVDLVLQSFILDQPHSTDDTALSATITVANTSAYKSKSFDITFYASSDLSFFQKNVDMGLARYTGKALNPGQSFTATYRLRDPIYYANNFLNGYYIGVHIDANLRVAETNDSNNALLYNACLPDHMNSDKNHIWTAMLGLGVLTVGGVAYQHLNHFLYGDGSPINWAVGSFASEKLKQESGYQDSVSNSLNYINKELRKYAKETNALLTSIVVPSRFVRMPELHDTLDLRYGISGTQGSAGSANIRLDNVEVVGNRRKVTYSADIYITYYDRYNFDVADSRKFLGYHARHLEMAGVAKPFDVSITAMTTVQASFWL